MKKESKNSTIWKFPIFEDENVIEVPKGTIPLSIGVINNEIKMWGIVDPSEKEKEKICIFVDGTGHKKEKNHQNPNNFLGTAILYNGKIIEHIFWSKDCKDI